MAMAWVGGNADRIVGATVGFDRESDDHMHLPAGAAGGGGCRCRPNPLGPRDGVVDIEVPERNHPTTRPTAAGGYMC